MKKEQCIELMKKWYGRLAPIYEIIFNREFTRREFAVLTPKHLLDQCESRGVRHMKITGVDSFQYCLDNVLMYEFQKIPYNFYSSIVTYREGLPKMSPVLRFRKEQIEEWKTKKNNQIVAVDLLIDVDSPDRETMQIAKEDTSKIHEFLKELSIPHTLSFTGMGYHIIIPYYVFRHYNHSFDPDEASEKSIYVFYNEIVEKISGQYSELVDTNGLHDSMRISKLFYSLTFYEDGAYVCWPFNSTVEFNRHSWFDYKLDDKAYFAGFQDLYKRGIKIYCVEEWTPRNTDQLLKKIGIKV